MLLALTAINRGSEIKNLDTRYMTKSDGTYTFRFSKTVKHSRQGKIPAAVLFHSFPHDKDLCPVTCLELYLERSKAWRATNKKTQLLLSFIKPHNPVSKSTITRWVKEVLTLSGIDTNVYQTHSIRAASSSKAGLHGRTPVFG